MRGPGEGGRVGGEGQQRGDRAWGRGEGGRRGVLESGKGGEAEESKEEHAEQAVEKEEGQAEEEREEEEAEEQEERGVRIKTRSCVACASFNWVALDCFFLRTTVIKEGERGNRFSHDSGGTRRSGLGGAGGNKEVGGCGGWFTRFSGRGVFGRRGTRREGTGGASERLG